MYHLYHISLFMVYTSFLEVRKIIKYFLEFKKKLIITNIKKRRIIMRQNVACTQYLNIHHHWISNTKHFDPDACLSVLLPTQNLKLLVIINSI